MKRFRSVQTRPDASILWAHEVFEPTSSIGSHPDLISKTRTLSEDQLTLIVDYLFPDTANLEAWLTSATKQAENTAGTQYNFENGITYSRSITDIPDV